MNERACQFGPNLNLFGILTAPTAQQARPDAPVVVLLNAGLLHHVGPHRMSVDLARRLAHAGFQSLRFDLGGRGDSETSSAAGSDEDRVLADIAAAMDFLEREQHGRRFVLFGLCAGADNAHASALRDTRVVGGVFLDGHGYWTPRSYIRHYTPRMFRPTAWLNYLRRTLAPAQQPLAEFGVHGQRRPFGPRATVEREIQALVDRGTELLYLYTGGVSYYYNYPDQFWDMFSGLNPRGRIEVELYPHADHTYIFAQDREIMFTRVVEWCNTCQWNGN